MKRVLRIGFALSVCVSLFSCNMNTDDENDVLTVSAPIEKVKKGGSKPSAEVDNTVEEPTEVIENPVEEPTEEPVEEPSKEIDWDKTIENINLKLYEKGCSIYNDRFFKDKTEIFPEYECDTFYPKIDGLEYTTSQGETTKNGQTYTYTHYEFKRIVENVQRVCNYLGISQESVIVWG